MPDSRSCRRAAGTLPPSAAVRNSAAGDLDDEAAVDALHAEFGHLHWVHAINNSALLAFALARGAGDFERDDHARGERRLGHRLGRRDGRLDRGRTDRRLGAPRRAGSTPCTTGSPRASPDSTACAIQRPRGPHAGGGRMSVVVVGSANLDLVYRVERIPSPGETVLATGSASAPGGKGNNQVTAVARAGAEVTFIAALGDDAAADATGREPHRCRCRTCCCAASKLRRARH